MLSTIEVLIAGTTGAEEVALQVDGASVATWSDLGDSAYNGQFVSRSWSTPDSVTADQVRIEFLNDLYNPAIGVDRNVRVDAIIIDGTRFDSENSDVYSTGTWLAEDGVTPGFRSSEYLHTNGYFQYADSASTSGSQVTVFASGDLGSEKFNLRVNDQIVRTWTVSTSLQSFVYSAPDTVTAGEVKIEFINDLYDPDNNIDRNLTVDRLEIDGVVFETESEDVYSTGTWTVEDGIVPGFRTSERLHTNGYFQFAADVATEPDDPPVVTDVVDTLNELLPDGWNWTLANDGLDVRIQTTNQNGDPAFGFRFGASGVISDLIDLRSGEQLLAPSFRGEATDRVIQWTIWEVGPTVQHDVPSLPDFEDRFNVTQAGTFDNVLHTTIDVGMDSANGVLDVWSVADRQWKSEQDPHMSGSFSSLTRYQVLDGGAVLVRRIIRFGEVQLNGQTVEFSDPIITAWTPFADAAFNSLALGIDPQGNPNHWYAESYNIPHFPNTPAKDTRGWATVYDRNLLRSGSAVSFVFGKDPGQVHLADGSTTEMKNLLYNSMDFSGGITINPSLWMGSMPAGSIVDQSFVLYPSMGIQPGMGATLDQLASQLPPPQVYHPGSNMDAEMSEIAHRLEILEFESGVATDNLGTVI